jgi:hypothetical protein
MFDIYIIFNNFYKKEYKTLDKVFYLAKIALMLRRYITLCRLRSDNSALNTNICV